jgi:hypothetical protein
VEIVPTVEAHSQNVSDLPEDPTVPRYTLPEEKAMVSDKLACGGGKNNKPSVLETLEGYLEGRISRQICCCPTLKSYRGPLLHHHGNPVSLAESCALLYHRLDTVR